MKKDEVVIGRTYLTKVGCKLVPVRIDETQGKSGWYATDRTTNKRVEIKNAKELRREIMDDEMAWEGEMAEAAAPVEAATITSTEPETTPDVATRALETPTEPADKPNPVEEPPVPTTTPVADELPTVWLEWGPDNAFHRVDDTPKAPEAPVAPSYDERLMFAGVKDPVAAREALANINQGGTEKDMATKNAKKPTKKNDSKATTKAPKTKREPKEKKVSALDAAARVLRESKEPMTTGEMIEAMAKKGYWSSPNGQTPAATLYSAILREINVKSKESRFEKTERGKFGIKA